MGQGCAGVRAPGGGMATRYVAAWCTPSLWGQGRPRLGGPMHPHTFAPPLPPFPCTSPFLFHIKPSWTEASARALRMD